MFRRFQKRMFIIPSFPFCLGHGQPWKGSVLSSSLEDICSSVTHILFCIILTLTHLVYNSVLQAAQEEAMSFESAVDDRQDGPASSSWCTSAAGVSFPPKKRWGREPANQPGQRSARQAGSAVYGSCPRNEGLGDHDIEGLQTTDADESEILLCTVCVKGEREALFIPCGHFRFCLECARKQYAGGTGCPSCGCPIRKVQKVLI